jgi:hypothetical protein
MRRRACPDRDGRDRPGHDEGEGQDGERVPPLSFRGESPEAIAADEAGLDTTRLTLS